MPVMSAELMKSSLTPGWVHSAQQCKAADTSSPLAPNERRIRAQKEQSVFEHAGVTGFPHGTFRSSAPQRPRETALTLWVALADARSILLEGGTGRFVFHPPCGSRCFIHLDQLGLLVDIAREFAVHGHIKRSAGGTIRPHIRHDLTDLLRRQQGARHLIDGHEVDAIPARSPAQWLLVRPPTRHPDRNPGGLQRLGQKGDMFEVVMGAVKAEGFAAPQTLHNLQPLIQFFGARAGGIVLPEGGKVEGLEAERGSKDQTPV